MARPLILSDQALVGGLRRDAVGDERYQSFRSLENFDIVYSPTVSLRRRDRFAAYLADWKPPSSITNLFATTLKTDDLAEVDVLYVVLEDGKIFRYNVTAPAHDITTISNDSGKIRITGATSSTSSTTDEQIAKVNDYVYVSGTSVTGTTDMTTFDGVHKITAIDAITGTYVTIDINYPTQGNPAFTATGGVYGTFYRIATLIHDMAVNTGSISQVDVDVNFQQVGDSVFFSTYTNTGDDEKGWYVDHLNIHDAIPVNPQQFPTTIVNSEYNNTIRQPDMALDIENANTSSAVAAGFNTSGSVESAVAFDSGTSILAQRFRVSLNHAIVFDSIYLPITVGVNGRWTGLHSGRRTETGNLKVYILGDDSGDPDWNNQLAESAWFNPTAQVAVGTGLQDNAALNRIPMPGDIESTIEQGWCHINNWIETDTKYGAGALWLSGDSGEYYWIVVRADKFAYMSQSTSPDNNLDPISGVAALGDSGFWWWTSNQNVSNTVYGSSGGEASGTVKTTSEAVTVEKPTTWVTQKNLLFDDSSSNPISNGDHPAGFIIGQAANLTTIQLGETGYVPATHSLYDNLKFAASLIKSDITPEFETQLDLMNNAQYAETRDNLDQAHTFKGYNRVNFESLPAGAPAEDSLGYPWATHYRLYRQVSSADPSWMWLCDLPAYAAPGLTNTYDATIHIAVSKFYQGLTDPRIYLLEDEDEKPISPTSVEVWNERIWLIDGRKLRFSARAESNSRLASIGEPIYHSFPLLNVIEFSEPITGLSIFSDRLVVFFKNNIKIIGGGSSVLNPPPDLITADIVKNEGTQRTDAIVAMKGGIVFVNQFGQVKMFNGSENTIDLSEPIQSLWETFGNNTTMFSTYYNEQLMIAVDTGGDNIIDKLYILDMARPRASWRIYDYSTNKLTAIIRTPDNQLLGSISTGTDYKIVVLGGRTSETYLETSVTAEVETHPVPSPNMSTWTKFILQGNYPSTPPSFVVTATAKDGKTSGKTITPLNDNDVRGHSGGLRIRSNECRLKIVTSGSNLDEVRSLTLA